MSWAWRRRREKFRQPKPLDLCPVCRIIESVDEKNILVHCYFIVDWKIVKDVLRIEPSILRSNVQ
jgi:hypothetical protein